jgi:hypothetical protein
VSETHTCANSALTLDWLDYSTRVLHIKLEGDIPYEAVAEYFAHINNFAAQAPDETIFVIWDVGGVTLLPGLLEFVRDPARLPDTRKSRSWLVVGAPPELVAVFKIAGITHRRSTRIVQSFVTLDKALAYLDAQLGPPTTG